MTSLNNQSAKANLSLTASPKADELCQTEFVGTRLIGLVNTLRVCGNKCGNCSQNEHSGKGKGVLHTHQQESDNRSLLSLTPSYQSVYTTPQSSITERTEILPHSFSLFDSPQLPPPATLICSKKRSSSKAGFSTTFSKPEGRFFSPAEPGLAKETPTRISSSKKTRASADHQQNGDSHQLDYLDLPGIRTLSEPEYSDFCIRVRAEQLWPQEQPTCQCDSGDIHPNGNRQQTILDEPRGLKSVKIILTRRCYKCRACGRTGLLPLDCLVNRRGMTQRLLDYLEKESLLRPFREVALEVGLSARTVREIFNVKKGVAEVERSATLTSPRVLGIDGVYINRKQCAILTDIENKEIIDIWESANADPLTEELKKLPDRDKIEVVIMDMAGPLKKAVEAALPRATIVIDRYHIQRMGNQAMDNVRIRLTPKRTSKAKRTMCERSLLRKHRSQLKKSEEMELKRWFSIMPELKLAYDLKEDFFSIWHTARKSTAKKRYSQWLLSLPLELKKDFKDILSAMNNWGEYIFNFFDFQDKKHTNAFTESTNRRIKDIQREARRGRFETVRAKAIYGTIMRKQLKEARTQQARPTWKRKNGERVVSEILLESSVLRELPSIQMSLF